ncbi:Sodium-coupled monocarboxylate transporter 1 [Ameca splendens]|uniref:Sodium-coupled monocarboxylate transporter 1 n=1 Tax=Ameca splendens TaxID=208324 RepID=A0ABV0Y1W4_9TELE
MTAVPVAMSLTASFMSGITVIGTPAEAYRFGSAFWLFGFSYAIMSIITAELFVPLFYRLAITSAYEYLELRFNRIIRLIGTSMYIVQTALYTGLVIYAPALALNQITGLDLWGVLVATGAVCIIYCTLGGLKAVIWTDVLQMVIMLAGFVAVIARGAVLQGGLSTIWKDAGQGGRLEAFDFDPDPLKRHTFWTIVIGGSIMWVSIYSINQSQVQRYISCKTLGHAKLSLYVNMVGLWVTVSLAVFSGLTMYSIYKNCDPLSNGDISTSDQLLPYLVMDILAAYPGIPGLFVAAAYSGTLSTVSSSINALVAVTVEDYIFPFYKDFTQKQVTWMNMGLSVFFGGLCIGMAGVASAMGSVLQAALSIFGMISGPLLGLYLLGMLFRTANSKGGLGGLIIGLALTLWVGIGAQLYPPTTDKTNLLHTTTAGCNKTMDRNSTTAAPWTSPTILTPKPDFRPPLADTWYSLSYVYFSLFGMLTTITSGLLLSIITGGCKQNKMNSDLFVRKSDLICFRGCRNSKSQACRSRLRTKELNKVCFRSFLQNKDLRAMETILARLICYLLVLSFDVAHAENHNVTTSPATPGSNLTEFTTSTLSNSTGAQTAFSNSTEDAVKYTSTKQKNETFTTTVAATESTSQHQTSQSASSLTSPTPTMKYSTLTITTQTIQTTTHVISTSDTPVNSTINSSPTITSAYSVNTTVGLRLNIPERNMTIIFSGMLGLFAVAVVMIMFYKCKHKIQYLHQPVTTTDDTDGFVVDDDTLVISGGLYDDHPIYDNVPPPPAEQSQFHLEFLR